jgi:hypothetical protein
MGAHDDKRRQRPLRTSVTPDALDGCGPVSYMGAAMKLTSVRSLAIGLLLSGCQVGAELAEDDTSTESVVVRGDGYFTLAHDTRRCVSPICGGYWVSPVNASSLRCVDGTTADRCYVGALDLAGLGIGATSLDGAIVYRGRIAAATGNAYGRFVASEAWRSATGALPTASVSRVSTTGTMCTFIPCETLNMQRVNSSARPLPVTGVDLSRLTTLSAGARDTVLGAATRDEGALVAGVRTTAVGNPSTERVPVLRATQVFVRVEAPTAARHCGSELQATFADAAERLLFTSESDAPLTWFARDGVRTVPTGAAMLRLLELSPTTRVEQITLDRLMRNAVLSEEGAGLADQHRAARFRQLVQVVNRELTGVTVFRVGEVQVRIFIVGRTRCGTLAGLETLAIET